MCIYWMPIRHWNILLTFSCSCLPIKLTVTIAVSRRANIGWVMPEPHADMHPNIMEIHSGALICSSLRNTWSWFVGKLSVWNISMHCKYWKPVSKKAYFVGFNTGMGTEHTRTVVCQKNTCNVQFRAKRWFSLRFCFSSNEAACERRISSSPLGSVRVGCWALIISWYLLPCCDTNVLWVPSSTTWPLSTT